MAATGYTSSSGDTRKVNRSGDTLTGDLVLVDNVPDTDQSATPKSWVLQQVAGAGTGVASDTVVSETTFGQAATEGVATTYSRGDHTHGTPASPGGGSTTNRAARVRIINDDLSGLPAAASWAIVQTSAGTKLQCSIAASAGHRIEVYPNFLYLGSHYLDWVLLDAAGAIAEYATSEGPTPPTEGNPAVYPSLTVNRCASTEMFTVGAGHINAGLVTIALAHQGLATGPGNRVYAHPTYPWRLRLKNIETEPP